MGKNKKEDNKKSKKKVSKESVSNKKLKMVEMLARLRPEEIEKHHLHLEKSVETLKSKLKQFTALVDVSAVLSSTLELITVLDIIMRESRVVTSAEASSLLLIDKKTDELVFYIAQGEKGEAVKDIRLKMGQGIAGWVAESGESVLVKDAKKDNRFFKGADEKSKFQTRNLMAVPLKGKREIIGVVEVLNKIGNKSFTKNDLRIFEAFAIQAGIAIENARLYEMAITDKMTKLFIKRYFNYRIDEEYTRARRYKHPFGMIMVDIDHFKRYNDTYGHQVGDKVITHVASIIKKIVRSCDIPCRFGGEEFSVIAPETDAKGVYLLGERIRKGIEESIIHTDAHEIKLTVSVGCSVYPIEGYNQELTVPQIIDMADFALYIGKNTGRNAVTLFDINKMAEEFFSGKVGEK